MGVAASAAAAAGEIGAEWALLDEALDFPHNFHSDHMAPKHKVTKAVPKPAPHAGLLAKYTAILKKLNEKKRSTYNFKSEEAHDEEDAESGVLGADEDNDDGDEGGEP
eukprot:NODE_7179_length_414_cov_117.898630_g5542_i0.p1 GENE.NODE_7179_length_414_cov_117.898630_g5542_i0~~NODE_7179_length_414_cov_117.898630_g5542_i0.p1  ORF type:complete len:115 (+),score=58.29 NODE_7179_length_414_cov_117.898630_g5542_i0:23-346(+)